MLLIFVRTVRILCPSFLVILFTANTLAQTATSRFEHISVEQGLSNFTPFCIAQDRSGFLWIGTEGGLNRYDGYAFKIYKRRPGDSLSLPTNTITGIAVDRNGILWLTAASEYLVRYDPHRDCFDRFDLGPGPKVRGRFVAGPICPDPSDDLLWIATNNGIRMFNTNTLEVKAYLIADSTLHAAGSNAYTGIAIEKDGSIWLAATHGVHRFDRTSGKFRHYFPQKRTPNRIQSRDVMSSVAIDGDDSIWIGTAGGLMKYDPSLDAFEPASGKIENRSYGIGEVFVVPMYVDASGDLWFGTFGDGMFKRDRNAGTFMHYHNEQSNPKSLLNDRVTCIFQDQSGVLWAGTYRSGLNKYNRRDDQFTRYPVTSGVYAVYEDSFGDLWLGTNSEGVYRFQKGRTQPQNYRSVGEPSKRVGNESIYSFCEDKNGDLWIGTGIGLDRFERRTGRFRHFIVADGIDPRQERTVKCLLLDSDGDLWAGTLAQGLYKFNREKNTFKAYHTDPNNSKTINGDNIWSVFEDSRKNLWVATFGGGLNLFDKKTGTVLRRFNCVETDSTSIGGDALYTVREDAEGNLWLGAFNGGLTKLNPLTGAAVRYSDLNGLPDNFVKTILFDDSNNVWVGTDKGLSCLNPRTGVFKNYKEKDGLHGNVFLSGAAFKSPNGKFYFGGEGGVTAFHPDSLKENRYSPPVVLTNFRVFDKPFVLTQALSATSHIELDHDENSFAFEFVSLDFSRPEKNQYAYKLQGIDHDWIQAGTRRYASYTHVPSGTFVFEVRGSNSDGVWSGNVARVTLTVAPPFWATWWFIGITVLVIGGIATYGYNYRVNRLLEIERLRVRIASDLHDEIGSSLTKISLQSELIQEGFDPAEQQNYLRNIAAMSRDLVTAMSDIVWSIDARNDTIQDLFDKMKSFGLSTLSAREISFGFSYSGFDLHKTLAVDIRENIYLIFKEAINNIAKHSCASNVTVVLRNDTDKCSMVIVDDGTGWSGTERPSGHGTKNMKMRSLRLDGSIEFVKDEGTRVVLSIPRL